MRKRNPSSAPDPSWDAEERAARKMELILPTEPERDMPGRDEGLIDRLYSWHGGQGSAVYSLASWGSSQLVSRTMIDAALRELKRDMKGKMPKADKASLRATIADLEMIRSYPREHSAKEAGMGLSEDEYEYDSA